MKRRIVWYINSTENGDQPPWEYSGGFITTDDDRTPAVQAKTNKLYHPMHMASKCDGLPRHQGVWTAFYRWDSKKEKFVCTRYRDYLRAQRKRALLASLKQDMAIAQSSDPVSA